MAINIPIITSFVNTGIQAADKQLKKFGTSAQAVAGAVGGLSIAFGTVKSVIGPAISAASNLQESMSKVNVIFGKGASDVEKFAASAARSMGQSKQSVLDAAGAFGTFGKAAGLVGQDLAVFSNDFTALASDLASFNNTSPEEAVQAIGAALRGEAEPLRRFGVLLNDATLKQEALNLGIYDGKGALTAQQKILAAQSAIYKQTTDAQGDFLRTSDGLANSQRTLSAEFANIQAQLGQKLLPLMEDFTQSLLSISDWVRRNPKTFNVIGKGLGMIAEEAFKASSRVAVFAYQLINLVANTVEAEKVTGAYNENLDRSSAAHIRAVDAAHEFNKGLKDVKDTVGGGGGATKKISELYDVISDKLTTALEDAKEQLKDAQEAFADFGQSVATSISEGFDFASAKEAGDETGAGFLAGLRDQAAGVKQYAENVDLLLKRGLSLDALQAVLDAGAEAGAAISAELIAGGQEAITGPGGVNELVNTVKGVADKLGLDTAGRFYQAGVDQGTALVAGLESVLAKYEKILKNPNLSTKRLNTLLEQAQMDIAFTQITAGQTIATPAPTPSQMASIAEHQAMRGGTTNYTVNVQGGLATSAEIGRVTQDGLRAFARQNGPLDLPIAGL
jgi:hypothetical protein